MKVISSKDSVNKISQDLLVVVCSPAEIKPKGKSPKQRNQLSFDSINRAFNGSLVGRAKKVDFKAKDGQCLALDAPNRFNFAALMLHGWDLDQKSAFEVLMSYRKLGASIFEQAERRRAESVCLASANLDLDNESNLLALYEGLVLSAYEYKRYKSEKKDEYKGIQQLALGGQHGFSRKLQELGDLLCEATFVARDLVNTPPRDCTPSVLRDKCREVARQEKLKLEVLDRKALKRLAANALLAVAQGSDEPPFLLKLTYRPKKIRDKNVISLVGKGVTFDSGGLSIKSASGMETMKYDMAGAAAVIAVMSVISRLQPAMEVRAYIPTTENMISGGATRPGDVVRAMNGKSIEILNTDAEGRLILADALSLAVKEKSDYIVDLATLTGAVVVALGPEYAGLFSGQESLVSELGAAAELSGERLWRMPLANEYKEMIKSHVADIKNTGGSWGGAITAAMFLKEFVGDSKWAHLDIAGPAYAESPKGYIKKGGVGFGVRTLLRFLLNFRQ